MVVDVSKLSFDSAFRYERIAIKSNTSFSVAAFGLQFLTIPHNLGYIPYVKSYYTYGDGKYFDLFSGNSSFGIDGNGGQVDTAYADATNYYIQISEGLGSPVSGTIYYRIYAEPQT